MMSTTSVSLRRSLVRFFLTKKTTKYEILNNNNYTLRGRSRMGAGEAPRSIRVRGGGDSKILAYALDDISGVLRMTNWGGAVLCKKSGHHYSMYIKRRGGVWLDGLRGWL